VGARGAGRRRAFREPLDSQSARLAFLEERELARSVRECNRSAPESRSAPSRRGCTTPGAGLAKTLWNNMEGVQRGNQCGTCNNVGKVELRCHARVA